MVQRYGLAAAATNAASAPASPSPSSSSSSLFSPASSASSTQASANGEDTDADDDGNGEDSDRAGDAAEEEEEEEEEENDGSASNDSDEDEDGYGGITLSQELKHRAVALIELARVAEIEEAKQKQKKKGGRLQRSHSSSSRGSVTNGSGKHASGKNNGRPHSANSRRRRSSSSSSSSSSSHARKITDIRRLADLATIASARPRIKQSAAYGGDVDDDDDDFETKAPQKKRVACFAGKMAGKCPTAAVNEGLVSKASFSLPPAAFSTDGRRLKKEYIYANVLTARGKAAVDAGKWRIMYIQKGFNCDASGAKTKTKRDELAKQTRERLYRWQSSSEVLSATGYFQVPGRLEDSLVHLYRRCQGEAEPGTPCTSPETSDVYECYAAEALCRRHCAGISSQHVCGDAARCKKRQRCQTPFTRSGKKVKCEKLVCAHRATCPKLASAGKEMCRRHFAKEHGSGCNCPTKTRR